MSESKFTLVIPYYRNPKMLAEQIAELNQYPDGYDFIVVDDGSPEPAESIVRAGASRPLLQKLQLYRVDVDIPWNRGGARNLGSKQATTKWLIHVDIDHLLPAGCAEALLSHPIDSRFWYRFPRYRRGKADDTRRKDTIPPDQEFGKIHPHIDSYVVPRTTYWKSGGYDEDYSGCLGGGTPFLKNLERRSPVKMLGDSVFLVVYTRSVIDDASDNTLSRDRDDFSKRRRVKELRGKTAAVNPIRFAWSRVL